MTAEQIIKKATVKEINRIKCHSGKPCKRCGKQFKEGDTIVMKKHKAVHYHNYCWESMQQ